MKPHCDKPYVRKWERRNTKKFRRKLAAIVKRIAGRL